MPVSFQKKGECSTNVVTLGQSSENGRPQITPTMVHEYICADCTTGRVEDIKPLAPQIHSGNNGPGSCHANFMQICAQAKLKDIHFRVVAHLCLEAFANAKDTLLANRIT
jgi:hypothetical protein